MSKRIVYVVGDLSYPNGMSRVLSQKVNYLAEHTDYEVYAILTENAALPHCFPLSPKVKYVNFDINFEVIHSEPLLKKLFLFYKKNRRYRQLFTDYLMKIRPDITVSVLRREINFINDINDGSKKVGEIHFNRLSYRVFNKRFLPGFVNRFVTRRWKAALDKQVRRLDRFVVLTREDVLNWAEFDNVEVIPNPVYTYPDHGSSCDSKQVIAVGRYTWQKGFDLLIEAWKQVNRRHPDWKLRIYGAGEPDSYRQQVARLGLEDCVDCQPATDDVYARYDESSLFVLSSRYEGLPLVLVEAMSAGLPCVAFACPCGPRDVITPGEDGLLVEPGNTDKLADALCQLMADDERRKRYGVAARQNARRYLEAPIMQKWINLFDQL